MELLKRYDILPDDIGKMQETPTGSWVKYNDVWTLDNNIFALTHNAKQDKAYIKTLEDRIQSLEGELLSQQEIQSEYYR